MNQQVTLLEALRAVPGVASADIEPDERPEGAGTLRLQLSPGADEVQVATSVNRVLREQFGLAVDANRVQVVEESMPARGAAVEEEAVENALDAAVDAVAAASWVGEAPVAEVAEVAGPVAAGPAQPEAPRPTLTAVPAFRDAPPPTAPAAPEPAPQAVPASITETIVGEQIEDVSSNDSADESAESVLSRPQRILIQRMQLVSAGLGVTTEVTLSWGGQAFVGESAAAATPSSVHRSVAQATLRATEAVIGGRARFELEQLEVNQLGPDRAVVVVVSMLTKVGSERLTGVSVVREDVRQAVIRATLDSLNRRIEALLPPS